MEAQFDDSRIITQFLPTLSHLASVEVAFLLIKEFGYTSLVNAYKRIQEGALIDSEKINKDPNSFDNIERLSKCKLDQLECESELLNRKISVRRKRKLEFRKRALEKRKRNMIEYCKTDSLMKEYRAQEKLRHHIPPNLRLRVMEAVQGINSSARQWRYDHFGSLRSLEGKYVCYWKSDGTFEGAATARQLVLNANIDIRKRFHVACTYCFEELIPTLWSELLASGQIDLSLPYQAMMTFWVGRLLDGNRVRWTQQFCNYRDPRFMVRIFFSSVFPLLQPHEREHFINFLRFAKTDDFRLCMQVMTREEETDVLELYPYKLLHCYLQWPLQDMFLEIAEKIWNYLDYRDFCEVVRRLLFIRGNEETDVSELFTEFWKKSPKNWKKLIKKNPVMRKKIKSWLKKIRQKRNAHYDELKKFHKYKFK